MATAFFHRQILRDNEHSWTSSPFQVRVLYHFHKNIFQLTVTATDGGGLTDTAQILIEVENLNDNLPSIKAAEVVYLDSNLQPGDLVIDLEVNL